MLFKLVSVIVLFSLFANYGQPVEMRQKTHQQHGVRTQQASAGVDDVDANGTQPERWADNASKGVLERRFRFRSRLNTHLLMLKFQR
jgi:hypothetical protein